jgi:hypothetical protein
MADLSVDARTAAAQANYDHAHLPRTLRKGTPGMRDAGVTYLPRWPREDLESWRARRDSSFLFGAYDQAVTGHTGRLFSKPIVLGEDVPDQIRGWWENIDLGGQHGDVFSMDAFAGGLDPGIGFILTDGPDTEAKKNKAEEKKFGIRPYCTYIPAEDILGWRTTRVGGNEVLTMVRILEDTEEAEGTWGEQVVRRVRVYYADSSGIRFNIHRQGEGKAGSWSVESQGVVANATRIALRPFYARRSGFFTGLPWMQAMAEKNLEHWQSASDQRAGLHFARVAALAVIGATQEEFKTTGFGHGEVLFNPNKEGSIGWLEYGTGGITAGERDLDKIVEHLSILGLEPLLHRPGDPTATAKAINEARATSRLLQAGRAFGDTLEGVFEDMAMLAGIAEGGGSVQVNEDFGLEVGDSSELDALLKAREVGDISRETLWEGMRRYGVLPDDFDAAAEVKRIDAESGLPDLPEKKPAPAEDQDGRIEALPMRFQQGT